MGGNLFSNTSSIKREDVASAVSEVMNTLQVSNLQLMGSAGKKAVSGDVDVVLDSAQYTFAEFKELAVKAKLLYGQANVRFREKNNVLYMSVPVPLTSERVQFDMSYGNPTWLQFSHASPGNESEWKGLYTTLSWVTLAKLTDLYRYPATGVSKAYAVWNFDLNYGLSVQYKIKTATHVNTVTANEFETGCPGPMPPRFTRTVHTDPGDVVALLLDSDLKDVNTFEKLLVQVYKKRDWETFKTKLLATLSRSVRNYDAADLLELFTKVEYEQNRTNL